MQFGESFSKLAIIAVGGIGQHRRRCNFLFYRLTNLLECDGRLGGKRDLFWNARLLAPFTILSPSLWQVQTPGDRKTGFFSPPRKNHPHSPIFLFAPLSAVLPHPPTRMLSFL